MKTIAFFLLMIVSLISCTSKKGDRTENIPSDRSDSNHIQQKESNVNLFAAVDISPMDMSYWPVDYPKLKMANDNPPNLKAKLTLLLSRCRYVVLK